MAPHDVRRSSSIDDHLPKPKHEEHSSQYIELETFGDEQSASDEDRNSPEASIHRPESIAIETEGYTTLEEKTVLRKLDRNLVFFLAMLYMLSFLDRSSKSGRSMLID